MNIALVAAMADGRVIGKDNLMPWHLPVDLHHFKQVTMGKPVVMGRKTFESIGRVLPGRRNIVVSSQSVTDTKGAEWVKSLEQAFELLADTPEVMVIGGAQIYNQCLPFAQKLYLTLIDLQTEGDAYFPDYQQYSWYLEEEKLVKADDNNEHDCRFITLIRQ